MTYTKQSTQGGTKCCSDKSTSIATGRPTARRVTTGRGRDADPHHHGRKSGEQRRTPLIYQPYGDDYLVVASKGGADEPPAWYLNLQADPEAEVQVKGDRFTARARTPTPDEKPDMWRTMTATWPAYDEYQEKTDREIPVVVLERAAWLRPTASGRRRRAARRP